MAKWDRGDFLNWLHPRDWFASLSRLLLGIALVVAVMIPYTQHAWNWDRFLQGGHDFETNLLLMLSFLCLVLVLSRRGRQSVEALFTLLREGLLLRKRQSGGLLAKVCALHADGVEGSPDPGWLLPLRI